MATQRYRHRLDHTVGENEATPTRATHPGRPELTVPPGGENLTPAPIAPVTTTADQARSTSWGRSSGDRNANPGQNGAGVPSSVAPGERPRPATINPLAPTDAVLDAVIRGGAHGAEVSDDWQVRSLDNPHDNPHKAAPVHDHFAKRAADAGSPGGMIPSKTGARSSADDSAARRAERLKQ